MISAWGAAMACGHTPPRAVYGLRPYDGTLLRSTVHGESIRHQASGLRQEASVSMPQTPRKNKGYV